MEVFVTGGSGYIGSALVVELLGAGHHVVGLARSDEAGAALTAAGAKVHRGSLEDLESLRRGAAAADGVAHLAFDNTGMLTDYIGAAQADLAAVETIGAALEGSGKPFVMTSGTLLLSLAAANRTGTEDVVADSSLPRAASENAVIAMAERGVRSSVIRLPPTVHGQGEQGFIPTLIGIARETGVSGYVGDGSNRWPAVHRLDAAHLYRLALESAPAGTRLHAAAEEGIALREIAEAIGAGLGVPVERIPDERASEHFAFLFLPLSLDNPTSSQLTRELLGWEPELPTLLEDIAAGFYFKE
jgi:nucleoside-diphosphate-sugar epimerase